jgi:hypothetical protein
MHKGMYRGFSSKVKFKEKELALSSRKSRRELSCHGTTHFDPLFIS